MAPHKSMAQKGGKENNEGRKAEVEDASFGQVKVGIPISDFHIDRRFRKLLK